MASDLVAQLLYKLRFFIPISMKPLNIKAKLTYFIRLFVSSTQLFRKMLDQIGINETLLCLMPILIDTKNTTCTVRDFSSDLIFSVG